MLVQTPRIIVNAIASVKGKPCSIFVQRIFTQQQQKKTHSLNTEFRDI